MADNTILKPKPVVISFVKKKRFNEVPNQKTAISKRIKLNQASNLTLKVQKCQYCCRWLKKKHGARKTHLRSCPSLEISETMTQFDLRTLEDDEDYIDDLGVDCKSRDSNENLYSFSDMNGLKNGNESDSEDEDLTDFIEMEENVPLIGKSENEKDDCLPNDSEISTLYECPICNRKYLFEKVVFDHIENYHKIDKNVQSKLGFQVIVLKL